MKLRGEVNGNISLDMQGISDTKNGEMQQEISLSMEVAEEGNDELSVKANLSMILKQNGLFLNVKDLTGSIKEYGEDVSIEEAMGIPTSGVLNQWLSFGGTEDFPLWMGMDINQFSAFQGELANAKMIQSLKDYPIFKMKNKNADGSYNAIVSLEGLKQLFGENNPMVLEALFALSNAYAEEFGEIRLVPKERSVELILKDEDYGEERTIMISANSVMGIFKDEYFESDFYFIYAKGNENIKF